MRPADRAARGADNEARRFIARPAGQRICWRVVRGRRCRAGGSPGSSHQHRIAVAVGHRTRSSAVVSCAAAALLEGRRGRPWRPPRRPGRFAQQAEVVGHRHVVGWMVAAARGWSARAGLDWPRPAGWASRPSRRGGDALGSWRASSEQRHHGAEHLLGAHQPLAGSASRRSRGWCPARSSARRDHGGRDRVERPPVVGMGLGLADDLAVDRRRARPSTVTVSPGRPRTILKKGWPRSPG
jgi:hypothetical protein